MLGLWYNQVDALSPYDFQFATAMILGEGFLNRPMELFYLDTAELKFKQKRAARSGDPPSKNEYIERKYLLQKKDKYSSIYERCLGHREGCEGS